MKNLRPEADPDGVIRLLSCSPDFSDHLSLEAGLECPSDGCASRWVVYRSASVAEAMAALQAGTIPVMVAEADSQSSPWRELLARIQPLPEPPALILASRLADERLWAEALNLGAYDVLAKPFAPHELIRSVTNAWLHWQGLRDHRHRALRDRRAVAYWNAAAG